MTYNFFRQIHLHTVLTQVIRTIFIDQLPLFLVFRKVHTMLASKSSVVCLSVSKPFFLGGILKIGFHILKHI
jgi:hypothetical protein